MKLIHF
jgi:hypothetical protein